MAVERIRMLAVAVSGPTVHHAVREVLGALGELDVVSSIAAGTDALRTTTYDVILLDLATPDGVRGVGALNGFAPDTPIIVISAGSPDELDLAIRAGAVDRIYPEELASPLLLRLVLQARERVRVAARARDADYRFAAFIDAIPLGVTIVDKTRDAYYANAEAQRILESDLTLTGLIGVERSPLDAAFEGGPVFDRDVEFQRGDRRLQLDVTAFPVLGPDGSTEYAAAVVQDITERKRLERAVRTMAKLDAMGAMAASVAHDFNNLLSVIGTFAYLALEELAPESGAYEDVAEIIKATERSQHLVAKLLSFAREGGPSEADSNINALVIASKKVLSRLLGDGVELELQLDDAVPRAAIAESEFEEILINLVVNARDAMPEGGTLSISTTQIPDAEQIVIRVADTGIGMDEQTRALLFEPLFTTKAPGKGTGLGLHSVRSLVTQAGGEISVESKLGAGTRFTLKLPAARAKATGESVDSRPEESGGSDRVTVLVVEDEESFRRMLQRQLGRLDYEVIEAANGRDALARAEEAGRIDVLLTDVDMPGMDGPSLAARLREKWAGLPVVFMTGFDPPQVPERVLLKPFPADELAEALTSALAVV